MVRTCRDSCTSFRLSVNADQEFHFPPVRRQWTVDGCLFRLISFILPETLPDRFLLRRAVQRLKLLRHPAFFACSVPEDPVRFEGNLPAEAVSPRLNVSLFLYACRFSRTKARGIRTERHFLLKTAHPVFSSGRYFPLFQARRMTRLLPSELCRQTSDDPCTTASFVTF